MANVYDDYVKLPSGFTHFKFIRRISWTSPENKFTLKEICNLPEKILAIEMGFAQWETCGSCPFNPLCVNVFSGNYEGNYRFTKYFISINIL